MLDQIVEVATGASETSRWRSRLLVGDCNKRLLAYVVLLLEEELRLTAFKEGAGGLAAVGAGESVGATRDGPC